MSTNCAGVKLVGCLATNSARWTNLSANACLLASSCASQLGWPTTMPRPISCVSGKNWWKRTGTGVPATLPKAAL
ncbi:MAG: hypothetical protein LC795_20910 [Acidobacteria bacterium]|nr:hypothetical protein [Acidobacteriota bacterium]